MSPRPSQMKAAEAAVDAAEAAAAAAGAGPRNVIMFLHLHKCASAPDPYCIILYYTILYNIISLKQCGHRSVFISC